MIELTYFVKSYKKNSVYDRKQTDSYNNQAASFFVAFVKISSSAYKDDLSHKQRLHWLPKSLYQFSYRQLLTFVVQPFDSEQFCAMHRFHKCSSCVECIWKLKL